MARLERIRLTADASEASGLLPVVSPRILAELGSDEAWWVCHDEGDLGSMVSLLVGPRVAGDASSWSALRVRLEADGPRRTDAEALARFEETVFVIGSSFVGKSGVLDERRAFIARFSEREVSVGDGSVGAEVLHLESTLLDRTMGAFAGIELMPADDDHPSINVEGAVVLDDDLVLGLRWPVTSDGRPLLVRFLGAAAVLTDTDWSAEKFGALEVVSHVVESGGTRKRPDGIRAIARVGDAIHVTVGQTERDLIAGKAKAAAARHLVLDGGFGTRDIGATEVERFEGFRKVEALAPRSDDRWLYALDDEDAIVLVVSS